MADSLHHCKIREGITAVTAMIAYPDLRSIFLQLYTTNSFPPNRELHLELDRKLIESSS